MKVAYAILFAFLFAASLFSCSRKTCESIADECDWAGPVTNACVEDYRDGGECRDALKEFEDCVEDNGCLVNSNGCYEEALDIMDICPGISAELN